MPNNQGYLKVVAALQKFTDMSISTNLYYNVNRYANKIPNQTELLGDIMLAYKYGIKNLYYTNTFDGDTQTVLASTPNPTKELVKEPVVEETDGCAGGACTL